MNVLRNRVELWFTVLCALPWLAIIAAYTEACFAWAILSHWPRPNLDDPKAIAIGSIHLVWQVLMISLIPAGILLGAVAARNWRRVVQHRPYSVRLGVFAVGLVLVQVLSRFDPGRVWVWLAD